MNMSPQTKSNSRRQRGVAAVEMAIIVLPMLLLCFGITEIGRALYQYNGLVKATRGAARFLSQQNLASPPPTSSAEIIREQAKSLAYCGKLDCKDDGDPKTPPILPNVPALEFDMISLCDPVACPTTHANISTGEGTTSLVSVVIGASDNPFKFTSLVPFLIPSIDFAPVSITMAASNN